MKMKAMIQVMITSTSATQFLMMAVTGMTIRMMMTAIGTMIQMMKRAMKTTGTKKKLTLMTMLIIGEIIMNISEKM